MFELQPATMATLAVGSVACFVIGLLAGPWVLIRLPPDYFIVDRPRFASWPPFWRGVLQVVSNLLGVILLFAGVAMLFLPGQGVLTLFVALTLLNFPGKKRLERRIASIPPVLRAINALRRRAHRPPLQMGEPE